MLAGLGAGFIGVSAFFINANKIFLFIVDNKSNLRIALFFISWASILILHLLSIHFCSILRTGMRERTYCTSNQYIKLEDYPQS